MFDINRSQENNNSKNNNLVSNLLNFSSTSKKDEFLDSLASGNKFVNEDLKIRSMVIDMLEKEFGKNISNINGYDFLVDSVVNKLKKKQLNSSLCIEDGV